MTVHLVACQMLEDVLRARLALAPDLASCRFLEYGLHTYPQRMPSQLQAMLDGIGVPGVVLLGYGLCGRGLAGLRAGPHTLVIPRADDCIALLIGSYRRFVEDCLAHPGTYYLSRGWLAAGYHPLGQLREWVPRYGEARTRRLLQHMYQNYRRVALVAFTPEELAADRAEAQQVAGFMGLAYDEILGAAAWLERLLQHAVAPNGTTQDFVVVPPGGSVEYMAFMH
jgi:hypothetical protein